MAPHALLDTAEISDKARRDLLQLLEGIRGKKNLVIERSLAGPVGLFVKFSTLQEYGVDRVFFLENDNVDASQKNIIFLARAEQAKQVISVAEQIKRLRRSSSTDHEFSIIWVPRRTLVSDQILEDTGVLGEASVSEYALHFIPVADDLLSLELDEAFGDLYLRKDPTSIFLAAKALMLLQQRHGLFPRIIGKGDNAKRLCDLLLRMRSEVTASEDSGSGSTSVLGLTPSTTLESLILIDREIDFPTVLMTQLTYEGLIDEVFNINSNATEVDSSVIGAVNTPQPTPGSHNSSSTQSPAPTAQPQTLKRKIPLDDKDTLYQTLRDSNFAIVGSLLNKVARRLQISYESRNTAKTTSELREFVNNLPGLQAEQASLNIHTSLTEEIMKHTRTDIFSRVLEVQQNFAAGADPATQNDAIDELINRAVPLATILRLLCLASSFGSGLRAKDLDLFRTAVLHAYGHQHLLTLSALEKSGLLTPRSSSALGIPAAGARHATHGTNYAAVRRSLHLFADEVNEADPNDIAYVFSGYAPLSVRLVQCIIQKQFLTQLRSTGGQGHGNRQASATAAAPSGQGWRGFEDAVKNVRGATFDEAQTGEDKAVRARHILNGSGANSEKTVIVFFLGGVCRAEIAALRFVSRKLAEEGKGKRILIATTGIITGDTVVGASVEERKFGNA
ncbi:vacuolar sorting protein-like protein [Patellaria atrata CBS 101060]|uniref:Vacuolar sorting protein-like protein n=1 Tax=Patellaria atrata CBS 101060 TaxID=1346257 RepID=A0A9P4VJP4_9PEZI|nr:vacuolar sorting protein-like protein [Patellaria atrata CBS 101060]